jgi:hypothetical protein
MESAGGLPLPDRERPGVLALRGGRRALRDADRFDVMRDRAAL